MYQLAIYGKYIIERNDIIDTTFHFYVAKQAADWLMQGTKYEKSKRHT